MIDKLAALTVRVTEQQRGRAIERRVEIVPAAGGDPLVSLLLDEAWALSWMLRRQIAEARTIPGR